MNRIKILKQVVNRLRRPVYRCVYTKQDGTSGLYYINSPKLKNSFGNARLGIEEKGVTVRCINRNGPRSFNYSGIQSITKVGLLEEIA